MSRRITHEPRERVQPTPATSAVRDTSDAAHAATGTSAAGHAAGAGAPSGAGDAARAGGTLTAVAPDTTPVIPEEEHAALLPSPAATAGAVFSGGALGFATVYSLSALQADPLFGVAVIVALFAVAMTGLKSLTDARTETGRVFAVALNALAIGATLGGVTVLV